MSLRSVRRRQTSGGDNAATQNIIKRVVVATPMLEALQPIGRRAQASQRWPGRWIAAPANVFPQRAGSFWDAFVVASVLSNVGCWQIVLQKSAAADWRRPSRYGRPA
jgi:predicted membrane metal-binding protein